MLPTDYSELDPDFTISSVTLQISDGLSPREYHNFALTDFSTSKDTRGLVNALSNAKRSLHFQVETLAEAFGILQAPNSKRNFPNLLEFLSKCGVITPKILSKLNKLRNSVEHDYVIPQNEDVEDYIDVVELFLAATDRFIRMFPIGLEFLASPLFASSPEISQIEFDPGKGEVNLIHSWSRNEDGEPTRIATKIPVTDPRYFSWVKFMVANQYR